MRVVHHITVCIYPCLPAGHTHTASVHPLAIVTVNSAVSLQFNPLSAELNRICHPLALLGAHHIFHVSG